MKKFLLLMTFFTSMVAYARAGEVGTKTFENVTGYCKNGKVTSIQESLSINDGFASVTYPLCKINGLQYRNIKFLYSIYDEQLLYYSTIDRKVVAKQVKNINLDGYDIEIDYDTRTIYVRNLIIFY